MRRWEITLDECCERREEVGCMEFRDYGVDVDQLETGLDWKMVGDG